MDSSALMRCVQYAGPSRSLQLELAASWPITADLASSSRLSPNDIGRA